MRASGLKILGYGLTSWLLVLTLQACYQARGNGLSALPDSSTKPDTLGWPASFGLGRAATTKEIAVLDIDVRPDGTGLPAGSGTFLAGKAIYAAKCTVCHGATGKEAATLGGRLVATSLTGKKKAIGNYWPYATTLFDYIRRAMPFTAPGSLTNDEVYSLTAFLLQANKVIDSTVVINAKTLPKIVMPAQKFFVPDDRKGGREVR